MSRGSRNLFLVAAVLYLVTLAAYWRVEALPPGERIGNALVSHVTYGEKMLWPKNPGG